MSIDLYKTWAVPIWVISPFLFGKLSISRASIIRTPFLSRERKVFVYLCSLKLFFPKFYFYLFYLFDYLFLVFHDRVSLCSFSCPGTL